MKQLFSNVFILGLFSLFFISCKKDESNFVTFTGGSVPVLSGVTNTSTENITLSKADADLAALSLT